jgi:hypothetical protein
LHDTLALQELDDLFEVLLFSVESQALDRFVERGADLFGVERALFLTALHQSGNGSRLQPRGLRFDHSCLVGLGHVASSVVERWTGRGASVSTETAPVFPRCGATDV